MNYEWVVGVYEGEKAREVMALANSGIAYYKIENVARGKNNQVAVAFRRPVDEPIPDHLYPVIDKYKINKLKKESCIRKSIHRTVTDDLKQCKWCGQK